MRNFHKLFGMSLFWIFLTVAYSFPKDKTLPDLIPYRKGDKWGFCLPVQAGKKDIKIVIPVKYDGVSRSDEGITAVFVGSKWGFGRFGFVDKKGHEIVPPKYHAIKFYDEEGRYEDRWFIREGLIAVNFGAVPRDDPIAVPENKLVMDDEWEGGKWGFVDKKGRIVIPIIYDNVWLFNDGIAVVQVKGKWGFINKKGWVVVPAKYDYVEVFNEGLANVALNGIYGFINKRGKVVIPLQFARASYFSGGLAVVKIGDEIGGKYGFIDKTGTMVIPAIYDFANDFINGLAEVHIKRQHFNSEGFEMATIDDYGFINQKGEEVVPIKYEYVYEFSDGLARVSNDSDKWGFVDRQGNEVIPLKFDYAWDFSEGLAAVCMEEKLVNRKYGYIDKQGNQVILPKYDLANQFSEGLAAVKLNDKWGFIDVKGNEVIPLKYDYIWDFREGLAEVEINVDDETEERGAQGYIDKNGTEYWED